MIPDYRNKLIKLIHVAKRELKLSDDTYQDILYITTKQTSCAKLSVASLEVVLLKLKEKGFAFKAKTQTQNDVIVGLWATLFKRGIVKHGTDAALNAYVKRMTNQKNGGLGIDHINWLKTEDASYIIECLKNWLRRENDKHANTL